MGQCPYKEKRRDMGRETQREFHVMRKAGIGVVSHSSNTRSKEKGMEDFPFELSRRNQPCQHLDFVLLTSRTVQE